VSPSDLPSWWHFNEAVLDGVRSMARSSFELPDETIAELDRLTIEDIGVTRFSEIVSSCFAGSSWFDLLTHLDGTVPSPCHDALARLAEKGQLAAVVTTNFDTLIERAFSDRGVPLDVYVPFEGAPPVADLDDASPCRLVKVHGSVTENSSLIDLARQKARGLPPLLRAWLSRVFAEHPVLVAGFSGADLDLGKDYFGFETALPRTPWLRWVARPGRPPLQAAASAIAMAPRGSFIEAELPDALETVGIEIPRSRPPATTTADEPREWVEAWLAEPGASPEACAALSARLLRIAEHSDAAASIRESVRAAAAERSANGVGFVEALAVSLALAQFGSDLVGTDPEQALADLLQSRRIVDALLTEEVLEALSEPSRIEQANNAAGVLFNVALSFLALSKPEEAEQTLAAARPFVEAIPPAEATPHSARAFHLDGLIQRHRDHYREALLSWRQASELAESTGLLDVASGCAENRWRTLAYIGEVDLARIFLEQAERLRSLVPTAPNPAEGLDLDWGETERRGAFPTLIDRLATEAGPGPGRFDEVLYSAWMAAGGAEDLRRQLREALAAIPPSDLAAMEPRQRALAAIARHALEGDDGLLEPAPAALSEWFWGNLETSLTRTLPEAKLVLHPELRDAVTVTARLWAQAGIERQRDEKWEEAERQFLVGGCGFALADEPDEAVRALLYAVDAMARQERLGEAEAMLGWLALGGGPKNTADVLSRRIKLLSYRVAADELDAEEAVELARPWLARLERLADDDQLGAALVALGSISLFADDEREAARLFERAETLLSDPEHRKVARKGLEQALLDKSTGQT